MECHNTFGSQWLLAVVEKRYPQVRAASELFVTGLTEPLVQHAHDSSLESCQLRPDRAARGSRHSTFVFSFHICSITTDSTPTHVSTRDLPSDGMRLSTSAQRLHAHVLTSLVLDD